MSNREILEKAINKALNNGWRFEGSKSFIYPVVDESLKETYLYRTKKARDSGEGEIICFDSYQELIFNHEFAKALFGEEPEHKSFTPYTKSGWQYHLQQMVIADDPIKYLGENI